MNSADRIAAIKKLLPAIVDDHSGGIKHIELLAELAQRIGPQVIAGETYMEEVEEAAAAVPELGVLKYVAKIGNDMPREKCFVYRKEG